MARALLVVLGKLHYISPTHSRSPPTSLMILGQLTIACIHPGNQHQLLGTPATRPTICLLGTWAKGISSGAQGISTASFGGVGSMPQYATWAALCYA
jgi:hypothetical protein